MAVDDVDDVAAGAAAVGSVADLARVLRALRRREARRRRGPELTYRQIANRTGWSLAVAGEYLTGARLASVERFDELVRLLDASTVEQGLLASARERVAASRAAGAEGGAVGTDVPRMLPAQVSGFVGRDAQLSELDLLLAGGAGPGTVVISALAGMGGVGKTALAVHWGHRAAGSFPDGQLYVNLRGYDPAEPMTPTEASGMLLSELGVAPTAMPVDIAGRIALYRRLLTDRRILVVLDNASDVAQVRPLLPPPSCRAVVTSRDDLAELVTVDGARPLTLDVLPERDAVALLRLLVGPRADADPDALRALARLCGHLPLALRVAAEQAAFRPTVGLAGVVGELRSEAGTANLDGLDATGDERADVRAVFSWSLRRLSAPAVRAFRLLGLVPGRDIDAHGLAALAGVGLAEAGGLAQTLARAHLVQLDGQGRFSMHDLVRAYAIDSAERDLAPDERRDAGTRLMDYYLTTATMAVDVQFPLNKSTRPLTRDAPVGTVTARKISDVRSAGAWLVAERVNLVQACVHGARHGWPSHAVALALVLRPLLDDGHFQDGLTVHTEALAAARALGDLCDPAARASLHGCLGITNWWLGRLDVAAVELQYAFDENTRLGNAGGATVNIAVLGLVRQAQGRHQEAIECQRRGLELARSAGIRAQEGSQLINLGYVHLRLEHYELAADLYQQAYDVFEQDDEVWATAQARYCLATAYEGLGRYDEALGHAEEGFAVVNSFGHLIDRIRVIDSIGSICRRMGRTAAAADHLAEALRLCRDSHNAKPTTQVLNTLGETCRDAGHDAAAIDHHREALELAEGTGDRFEGARALVGLGDAYASLGDTGQAHSHWRQALDAYTQMNLPAAARIWAKLSMSGQSQTARPEFDTAEGRLLPQGSGPGTVRCGPAGRRRPGSG